MNGSPFATNVRRMYQRASSGGSGADYAEEQEERLQAEKHRSWSAGGTRMKFSHDPTSRGDEIADYVREYYERHRESWWTRLWRYEHHADEFMIGLINEVRRVEAEAKRQSEGPTP